MYSQQPPEEAAKILKEYVLNHSDVNEAFYGSRDWIVNPIYDDHNHIGGFVINLRGTPAKFTFFIYINDGYIQHIQWLRLANKGEVPRRATKVRSALKALVKANGFDSISGY